MLIGAKQHTLADPLVLTKYNIKDKVELVGIDWDSKHWIIFYTPNSFTATTIMMLDTLQQYKGDRPDVECIFSGDRNAHNSDWITSTSTTDKAGLQAQEFAEMFDLKQLVVVVVNILFQIKNGTLMIGHCTALAVIATKTLAGKKLKRNKIKMESL